MRGAAVNPLDWVSYIFGQSAFKIFQNQLITFLQQAVGQSETASGVTLSLVGIGVGVFSPFLLGRYYERPMFFWGAAMQLLSFVLLAISGIQGSAASSNKHPLGFVAYPALFALTIGTVWVSAMQAILTTQYPTHMQGAVLGGVAQLGEMCVVFAYPIGILFSYTIQANTALPWPGVIWVAAAVYLGIAMWIQIYSFTHKLRRPAPAPAAAAALTDTAHSLDGGGCCSEVRYHVRIVRRNVTNASASATATAVGADGSSSAETETRNPLSAAAAAAAATSASASASSSVSSYVAPMVPRPQKQPKMTTDLPL
jgi:hypothetical protein